MNWVTYGISELSASNLRIVVIKLVVTDVPPGAILIHQQRTHARRAVNTNCKKIHAKSAVIGQRNFHTQSPDSRPRALGKCFYESLASGFHRFRFSWLVKLFSSKLSQFNFTFPFEAHLHWMLMIDVEHQRQCLHDISSIRAATHF